MLIYSILVCYNILLIKRLSCHFLVIILMINVVQRTVTKN
jgi:hypothetical protein